jgi:thiol-disulfide isomerase/thioredoxin
MGVPGRQATRTRHWFLGVLAATLLIRPAAADDAKADAAEGARRLLDSGRYEEALKAFKAANASQKGQCAPCLLGMAEAQLALDKADEAEDSCRKALKLGIGQPGLRALALSLQGITLATRARTPKDLHEAEESLRGALEADPRVRNAQFSLGVVLLRQARDEEGIGALRRYLETTPTGAVADRARRLIDNPRRARERFAPDFEVKSLEGTTVSLQTLSGKVVLLDFWATWCAPCRAAIPELKDLARRYPRDRLSIVSVSEDDEEEVARGFVAKNGMTWTQCHDREKTIRQLFRVNAFPTYFVIDGEGVIRKEIHGTDPQYSVGHRIRATLDSLPELSAAARQ